MMRPYYDRMGCIQVCLALPLLFSICVSCRTNHQVSAFIIPAQDSVYCNTARNLAFLRHSPCQILLIPANNDAPRIRTRLKDSPDGSKQEGSLQQRQSNGTATTADMSSSTATATEISTSPNSRTKLQTDPENRNDSLNLGQYANAAAGSLGDIMSREDDETDDGISKSADLSSQSASRQTSDGLVTTPIPSGSLASQFGIVHPLDRMALTANGNLQRLVSSYYDAPVQVLVDSCDLLSGGGGTGDQNNSPTSSLPNIINRPNAVSVAKRWDRVVHLTVHNQPFCTAHSVITVYDPICQGLVESGQIGIGQLFRYLDILPEFELHNAGPHPTKDGGGFWREYTLKCAELSCDIREDFQSGMWEIPSKLPSSISP